MTLVVREGIYEMFDYLAPFCTFYVYSHGLKQYIFKILDIIDPHQRYFKNREERVLAPRDSHEQELMRRRKKSFTDFKRRDNPTQNLFTDDQLRRCVILDD